MVRLNAYDASTCLLFHFDLCWPSSVGSWHKQTVWTQVIHERHPTDLDPNRLIADKTGTTRRGIILQCCSRGLFGDHAASGRSLYCSQMPLNKWNNFKNVDIHREPARPGAYIFSMCVQKDSFWRDERVQNLVRYLFKAWFCALTWHTEIWRWRCCDWTVYIYPLGCTSMLLRQNMDEQA